MKKIILHIINGENGRSVIKKLFVLGLCYVIGANLVGCMYKNRGDYLAKVAREEDEQSDTMMQSIIDALDTGDAETLKNLFSPYALEYAENLDEKIEELMEFYPGCEGGFEGDCVSRKITNYGDIVLTLEGMYTLSNNNGTYLVSFIMQPQNDEEPEKIGLHLIEIIKEDAIPEGFKLKSQDAEPGIYVHE